MLPVVFALVFLIGACVGSFLNVCAYRLPYEKSILWPSSRCGSCYQPIRWYDNIPLVSYWLLRGRCRDCGVAFSSRYFWVELGTALLFSGLFYVEIIRNALDLPFLNREKPNIELGLIPLRAWFVFGYHGVLLGLLIAASLCDLDHMEIPLSLTLNGTLIGLIGSMIFAWPFPADPPARLATEGLYPWPIWHDLPAWLPQGSWRLGLATGLAGAAMGMVILRGIRFLFGLGRGMEGLGIGDADLFMMAGAFVGWQVILVSFFVAIIPGLFLGLFQVIARGNQALPFGPSLAIGVLWTLLTWSTLGKQFELVLKQPIVLLILAGMGAVFMLILSFLLRLLRGNPDAEP